MEQQRVDADPRHTAWARLALDATADTAASLRERELAKAVLQLVQQLTHLAHQEHATSRAAPDLFRGDALRPGATVRVKAYPFPPGEPDYVSTKLAAYYPVFDAEDRAKLRAYAIVHPHDDLHPPWYTVGVNGLVAVQVHDLHPEDFAALHAHCERLFAQVGRWFKLTEDGLQVG